MQVSWIEAEDLKELLARISLPEDGPAAPKKPAEPSLSLLAEPNDPFIVAGLDAPAPVADPFDALDPAAAFVNAQPAVPDPLALAQAKSQPGPSAPAAAVPIVAAEPVPAAEAPPPAVPTPAILPLSRIRDKLRAIRQRAHEAGMLGKAPEKPASAVSPFPAAPSADVPAPPPIPAEEALAPAFPVFTPVSGTVQERLSAFAAWARRVLNEDGGHLLVMNDDGELLWGGEAKAGLVLSAMMAWNATMRASAHAAYGNLPVMRQPLASGHVLTVIPCQTAPGTLLHIAVAAPCSLADPAADELRQALAKAMAANEPGSLTKAASVP